MTNEKLKKEAKADTPAAVKEAERSDVLMESCI